MGYRNIEVNGRDWKWKVGKTFLDIRDPNGKGYRPKKDEVGEMRPRSDPDWGIPLAEEAIAVTTAHVRKFIENIRS